METETQTSHIPVMLDAVLENLLPAKHIIDGTLGAGGHTSALLEHGAGEVLGLDRDPMALEIASTNLAKFGERAHITHATYADMVTEASRIGWDGVDGILLDLGVSSMQLDTPERGFAFRHDGPLDMRFDPDSERSTAAELVNYLDERELADLIFKYGEDPQARKLAGFIVRGRPYETTRQLADAIERGLPRRETTFRKGKRIPGDTIHPATQVFQALRIAVNDELAVLEKTLPDAINLLRPGGRLAVISFHSLEDRVVKQAFKLASTDCICPPEVPVCRCGHEASVELVNRKPIVATDDEIRQNPRSRSAKLRVAERVVEKLESDNGSA